MLKPQALFFTINESDTFVLKHVWGKILQIQVTPRPNCSKHPHSDEILLRYQWVVVNSVLSCRLPEMNFSYLTATAKSNKTLESLHSEMRRIVRLQNLHVHYLEMISTTEDFEFLVFELLLHFCRMFQIRQLD